jgi:hypothetical protein
MVYIFILIWQQTLMAVASQFIHQDDAVKAVKAIEFPDKDAGCNDAFR